MTHVGLDEAWLTFSLVRALTSGPSLPSASLRTFLRAFLHRRHFHTVLLWPCCRGSADRELCCHVTDATRRERLVLTSRRSPYPAGCGCLPCPCGWTRAEPCWFPVRLFSPGSPCSPCFPMEPPSPRVSSSRQSPRRSEKRREREKIHITK